MVKRALLAVLLAAVGISLVYAGTPADTEPLAVPAGTILHCRTTQTLTTKLNVRGDAFTLTVSEPVSINGSVAIPVGTSLNGHVTLLARPGRIAGVGQMRLTIEQMTLPDGRNFPVGATLLTAYGADKVKVVGSEGLIKGPNSHVPDMEEIGAGTVGGTLLGLIFLHPVVGATVGFTATTVDRMRRRGKDLTLTVGTQLNYQLTRELAIGNNATQNAAANQVHSAGE
jgi:hypothetical protein